MPSSSKILDEIQDALLLAKDHGGDFMDQYLLEARLMADNRLRVNVRHGFAKTASALPVLAREIIAVINEPDFFSLHDNIVNLVLLSNTTWTIAFDDLQVWHFGLGGTNKRNVFDLELTEIVKFK